MLRCILQCTLDLHVLSDCDPKDCDKDDSDWSALLVGDAEDEGLRDKLRGASDET